MKYQFIRSLSRDETVPSPRLFVRIKEAGEFSPGARIPFASNFQIPNSFQITALPPVAGMVAPETKLASSEASRTETGASSAGWAAIDSWLLAITESALPRGRNVDRRLC